MFFWTEHLVGRGFHMAKQKPRGLNFAKPGPVTSPGDVAGRITSATGRWEPFQVEQTSNRFGKC